MAVLEDPNATPQTTSTFHLLPRHILDTRIYDGFTLYFPFTMLIHQGLKRDFCSSRATPCTLPHTLFTIIPRLARCKHTVRNPHETRVLCRRREFQLKISQFETSSRLPIGANFICPSLPNSISYQPPFTFF